MVNLFQKRSAMVKKVPGIGVKSGVPEIFTRPKSKYKKVASYWDDGRKVGGSILEVASTADEKRMGLMGRKSLPWVCGMVFEDLSGGGYFWMKNCHVGLDVMFMDKSGNITKVYSMPADDGEEHYGYDEDDVCAIEVPMGFCRKNGVSPGCRVKLTDIGK